MVRNDSYRHDKEMIRLFIALHFPQHIKDSLEALIADLKPRARGIKWVEPKNIHLTLKFIGEVPENKIEPIVMALSTVLDGRKKFESRVAGCGGFPNLRRPRVLWVGLAGAEPAAAMAREINDKLVPIGIETEKRGLSPHLTLGRIKTLGDFSELAAYMENLNFDAGMIILNRVALVRSTLTPGGPIYENLKLFELE
jgi:2'-5' RNA ligase